MCISSIHVCFVIQSFLKYTQGTTVILLWSIVNFKSHWATALNVNGEFTRFDVHTGSQLTVILSRPTILSSVAHWQLWCTPHQLKKNKRIIVSGNIIICYKICTWFSCALFCCGYVIVSGRFMRYVFRFFIQTLRQKFCFTIIFSLAVSSPNSVYAGMHDQSHTLRDGIKLFIHS